MVKKNKLDVQLPISDILIYWLGVKSKHCFFFLSTDIFEKALLKLRIITSRKPWDM